MQMQTCNQCGPVESGNPSVFTDLVAISSSPNYFILCLFEKTLSIIVKLHKDKNSTSGWAACLFSLLYSGNKTQASRTVPLTFSLKAELGIGFIWFHNSSRRWQLPLWQLTQGGFVAAVWKLLAKIRIFLCEAEHLQPFLLWHTLHIKEPSCLVCLKMLHTFQYDMKKDMKVFNLFN